MDIKHSIFYFKDGEIRFNEIGILFDPSFAKLFRRKHEVSGDSQGRNKIRNFQEAKFIYMVADPMSYPNQKGFTDAERFDYAKITSGLPNDWIPDDVVKSCVDVYKKHTWTVIHEQIFELNATFHGFNKIVSKIRTNIDNLMSLDTMKKDEISELIAYYKQLISIATELPSTQNKLMEAIKQLNEASKDDEYTHMRGSTIAPPDSADPDLELRR